MGPDARPVGRAGSTTLSSSVTDRVGDGPYSEVGTIGVPRAMACCGELSPIRPTILLIQPRRSTEPGSASSTASMAAKWLRSGACMPTACTAPKVPSPTSRPAA